MKLAYKTIYNELLQTYSVIKNVGGKLYLQNENYPKAKIRIIEDWFNLEDGVMMQYNGAYKYEIIKDR
jgi:hypothetical protein